MIINKSFSKCYLIVLSNLLQITFNTDELSYPTMVFQLIIFP